MQPNGCVIKSLAMPLAACCLIVPDKFSWLLSLKMHDCHSSFSSCRLPPSITFLPGARWPCRLNMTYALILDRDDCITKMGFVIGILDFSDVFRLLGCKACCSLNVNWIVDCTYPVDSHHKWRLKKVSSRKYSSTLDLRRQRSQPAVKFIFAATINFLPVRFRFSEYDSRLISGDRSDTMAH